MAVAPGLVVCGSSCRRIGVPARSSVAFLRYPRDGCAISVLVRVRDRKGLALVQHLLLVYGFIRIRVTGVRVVLRTRTSCASALVVSEKLGPYSYNDDGRFNPGLLISFSAAGYW